LSGVCFDALNCILCKCKKSFYFMDVGCCSFWNGLFVVVVWLGFVWCGADCMDGFVGTCAEVCVGFVVCVIKFSLYLVCLF